MNGVLYLAVVFCWGLSWIAIAWQTGELHPLVSIFYRFALSALIFLIILRMINKLKPTRLQDHVFFALQGACLFCLNFVGFYFATHYMASGLVSLVMSTAIIINALLSKVVWNSPVTVTHIVATILGFMGLALVFAADISSVDNTQVIWGVLWALFGTFCFSLGNMISIRNNKQGVDLSTATAWGMGYGTLINLALIMLMGATISWPGDTLYLGSLLYLVIFASIFGFTLYLKLVNQIGATQAAYALVVTPIVALMMSALYEDYTWQANSIYGLLFILSGNLLVLAQNTTWLVDLKKKWEIAKT